MRRLSAVLLLIAGCAGQNDSTANPRPAIENHQPATIALHIATAEQRPGWRPIPSEKGESLFVEPQPFLTGEDLRAAEAFHGASGSFLQLQFSGLGAQRLQEATRANLGQRLAILIDDKVISSPRIQSEIAGGQAHISGSFTRAEADELATRLQATPTGDRNQ